MENVPNIVTGDTEVVALEAFQWAFGPPDCGSFSKPVGVHEEITALLVTPLYQFFGRGASKREFMDQLYAFLANARNVDVCDLDFALGLTQVPLLEVILEALKCVLPNRVQFWNLLRTSDTLSLADALLGNVLQRTYYDIRCRGKGERQRMEVPREYMGFLNWASARQGYDVPFAAPFCGGAECFQNMEVWAAELRYSPLEVQQNMCVLDAYILLDEHFDGLPSKLLSKNLVIAGGCVKKAICGMKFGNSDCDCWFVGLETADEVMVELERAVSVLKQYSLQIRGSRMKQTILGTTMSVQMYDNYGREMKFQFPLRAYECVEQVIVSFDCPPVQAAFSEGGVLYTTDACDFSLANKVCVVDPSQKTTTRRLIKQLNEGFSIAVPMSVNMKMLLLKDTRVLSRSALETIIKRADGTMTSVICFRALKEKCGYNVDIDEVFDTWSASCDRAEYSAAHVGVEPLRGKKGRPDLSIRPMSINLLEDASAKALVRKRVMIVNPAARMYGAEQKVYIDTQLIKDAQRWRYV